MKSVFSRDHAEVIGMIWSRMSEEHRTSIYISVAHALGGLPEEGKEPTQLEFSEVTRVSWCLGFHYAMCAMEAGALIKVGPGGNPEKN